MSTPDYAPNPGHRDIVGRLLETGHLNVVDAPLRCTELDPATARRVAAIFEKWSKHS